MRVSVTLHVVPEVVVAHLVYPVTVTLSAMCLVTVALMLLTKPAHKVRVPCVIQLCMCCIHCTCVYVYVECMYHYVPFHVCHHVPFHVCRLKIVTIHNYCYYYPRLGQTLAALYILDMGILFSGDGVNANTLIRATTLSFPTLL